MSIKGASILLVDDDLRLLESMTLWLRDQGLKVHPAGSVEEANAAIDNQVFDLAVADIRLGDHDGFEVLKHSRESQPDCPVILFTGYGTVDTAIDAIRAGAFDFLTKPLIDEELELAISRALNQREMVQENKNLKAQLDKRYGLDSIVGHDAQMLKIFDLIESVADTRTTVLITGESGTGKSMIARAVHRLSSRRDKPFVEVACGALPETLLESELFGHVAGAFTGASTDKIGKFKQADGGTLFLDEIGTASPQMQVKLLRVLQEFSFEQVGGNQTFEVDTRVVLATNEDLASLVENGTFRQDLYYRINVISIEIPPLRKRIADIPELAQQFVDNVNQQSGRQVRGFTDDAMTAMQRYQWPGNVRELQNVVERSVLLTKNESIRLRDLPAEVLENASYEGTLSEADQRNLKQALRNPERQIILDALEARNWNRTQTAEFLGINRTTLYKKMKKLGIDDQDAVKSK
ncbi:MAG: sigma-54 dependent transcriptional regulator [Pirellulales bacterium]|nr:sigma-54 dependent transcriptional regulator [Pirellulales bacterium]